MINAGCGVKGGNTVEMDEFLAPRPPEMHMVALAILVCQHTVPAGSTAGKLSTKFTKTSLQRVSMCVRKGGCG